MRSAENMYVSVWAVFMMKVKFADIVKLISEPCPEGFYNHLRKVKSSNPVMILDEIDKVGTDFRGDPIFCIAGSAGP